MALQEYAGEHDGAYPLYLSELAPDYIAWDYVRYSVMSPRWKIEPKYDWLYFAAGRDGKYPPRIIIASPQAVSEGNANKRIVVYDDLSTLLIPEDQYQRELHQMIEKMKKRSRRPVPAQTPEALQIRGYY